MFMTIRDKKNYRVGLLLLAILRFQHQRAATAECTTLNAADITSDDTGPGTLARTIQWCIRCQPDVWAEILLPINAK